MFDWVYNAHLQWCLILFGKTVLYTDYHWLKNCFRLTSVRVSHVATLITHLDYGTPWDFSATMCSPAATLQNDKVNLSSNVCLVSFKGQARAVMVKVAETFSS